MTSLGFDPDELGEGPAPDDVDRERALKVVKTLDLSWHAPNAALVFDEFRWRPHLVAPKGRILHLALDGDLPQVIIRRLRAASSAGYKVTVALGVNEIHTDTLIVAQETDARIISVDWERAKPKIGTYRSVADWIAAERIALDSAAFHALASKYFSAALSAPPSRKGRLYEEVLCLVFSQVSWLTVDEHSFRNATEEIDLILGIHAAGHVSELVKSPMAVATAKNETTSTGSSVVKYLKEQISNRHKRCKLGFLCSASTISGDAKTEVLRGSQDSELVLVPIERQDLWDLINAADELDQRLLAYIRKAVAS